MYQRHECGFKCHVHNRGVFMRKLRVPCRLQANQPDHLVPPCRAKQRGDCAKS
jgi:hypothetical protein